MTNSGDDPALNDDHIRGLLHRVAAMPMVRRQPTLVGRVAAAEHQLDALPRTVDNTLALNDVVAAQDTILATLQEIIKSAKRTRRN